jgi:hypothetical protein
MELTIYSKMRLTQSAVEWRVCNEYFEPMYNYLIHGFEPGSFFYKVLCNDWFGAIQRSHPANTVVALKEVSGWIVNSWPRSAWGSRDQVDKWLTATDQHRRAILAESGLIFTEQQEVELVLRDANPNMTLQDYNSLEHRLKA